MEDFLRGEAIMEVAIVGDISRKRKVRLIWARKKDQTKGIIDGGYSAFVMKKLEPRYISYDMYGVLSDLGTFLFDMTYHVLIALMRVS